MTTKVKIILEEDHSPVGIIEQSVLDGKWVDIQTVANLSRIGDSFETHIHQNKRLIVRELPTGNA